MRAPVSLALILTCIVIASSVEVGAQACADPPKTVRDKCQKEFGGRCDASGRWIGAPQAEFQACMAKARESGQLKPAPGKCSEQPGWITCQEWCTKNRVSTEARESCLHAHQESCMKKYGSLATCVRDQVSCSQGQITCQAWCNKYRSAEQRESCLHAHPGSCMKKYGSLTVCMSDRPN